MSIPPWHMWGSVVTFNAQTTTPAFTYTSTQQIARVEYHRPESWRFLFFCKLLASEQHSPSTFTVDFEVIPGVGRASVNLNPFERYRYKLPIGKLDPTVNYQKFSTTVIGPVRDETLPDPPDPEQPNIVDSFTAQDIQVSASVAVSLTVPGDFVQAQVGCLLAPWHHARPDWEKGDFTGGELKGR